MHPSTFRNVPTCLVRSQAREEVAVVYCWRKRINIKFCVKISKSASEMSALLKVAYDEYAMKKSSVFELHRQFKEL
jgi:hypothetical protein